MENMETAAPAQMRRTGRSPRDMAISLAVLLVPVILGVLFYRLLLDGDKPVVVDPTSVISEARSAGAFPVSEPTGLDSGWRTVSARYQPGAGGALLRLGYLTPGGGGVQLVQGNIPADQMLPQELTNKARPDGQVDLAGTTWQRYRARPGERALVLLEPTHTVIVIGSTAESDLRTLAEAVSR
jgi:hypothetical protein